MNLNEITALLSLFCGLLMLRGGVSLLVQADDRMLRHLGWATVLLVLGVIGRGVFWDLGPVALGDVWKDTVAALGGLRINTLFHAMTLLATWHFLRMIQMLIPIDDRPRWSIWRAPFYPRGLCVERVVMFRKSEKDK